MRDLPPPSAAPGGPSITHYDETTGVPLIREAVASQQSLGHTVVPLSEAYNRRLSRLQVLCVRSNELFGFIAAPLSRGIGSWHIVPISTPRFGGERVRTPPTLVNNAPRGSTNRASSVKNRKSTIEEDMARTTEIMSYTYASKRFWAHAILFSSASLASRQLIASPVAPPSGHKAAV